MKSRFLLLLCFIPQFVIAMPDWVVNPPTPDNAYTGSGSGTSLLLAKQDALQQIANSITSVVTSHINLSATEKNTEFAMQASAEVISDSVLLPPVQWQHMTQEDGIYYALASINKSVLIAFYERDVDTTLKQFSDLQSKEKLDLADFLRLQQAQKSLQITALRASAIASNSELATQQYQQLSDLFEHQNAFKQSMCFKVRKSGSTGYAKKIIQPAIEDAIHRSGLKLLNKSSCTEISFDLTNQSQRGKKLRIETISLQLRLGAPVVATKVFNFSGKSQGKKLAALNNAAANFSQYFNQQQSLLQTLITNDNPVITITKPN